MGRSILFVAGEGLPFVKTGGLADVIGALPKALVQKGHDAELSFLYTVRSLKSIMTSWKDLERFKSILDGSTSQQHITKQKQMV